MAEQEEGRDGEGLGDVGNVRRAGGDVPAWVSGGTSVARPVVRHPAYMALGRSCKERCGRRADAGRAMVPEHDALIVCVVHTRIVDVKPTTIRQREIDLCQRSPTLPALPCRRCAKRSTVCAR